jgi:hypothetical protein
MSGKDDLESQKSQSRKDLHEENKEKHVSPPQLSQHNEEDVSHEVTFLGAYFENVH